MKKIIVVFLCVVLYNSSNGQNLVPNPSFEAYSSCPSQFSQLDRLTDWFNPTNNSPDFFHQCATHLNVRVPQHTVGYQQARTGAGYAGIYLFANGANAREYIEVKLTSPLVKDTVYYFEMYANLFDPCKFTTSHIGMHFSNTLFMDTNAWSTISFIPQITNPPSNVLDTANWTKIQGSFTAAGGEEYMIIGNFDNDSITNAPLVREQGTFNGAFSLIDDLQLIKASQNVTALNDISKQTQFQIFPNPASTSVVIKLDKLVNRQSIELEIINLQGQVCFSKKSIEKTIEIDISKFTKGMYFIQVKSDGARSNQKLLIK